MGLLCCCHKRTIPPELEKLIYVLEHRLERQLKVQEQIISEYKCLKESLRAHGLNRNKLCRKIRLCRLCADRRLLPTCLLEMKDLKRDLKVLKDEFIETASTINIYRRHLWYFRYGLYVPKEVRKTPYVEQFRYWSRQETSQKITQEKKMAKRRANYALEVVKGLYCPKLDTPYSFVESCDDTLPLIKPENVSGLSRK